jgi:hypothetical protein
MLIVARAFLPPAVVCEDAQEVAFSLAEVMGENAFIAHAYGYGGVIRVEGEGCGGGERLSKATETAPEVYLPPPQEAQIF